MSKRGSHREIETVISESPFQFKELIVHILCMICTSRVNGKTNIVNVSLLREVNRTFCDEIDNSLLLWRFMMRFTRRAMIEPPIPIPIKTISEIKEFIILDSEEIILRDYLFSMIRKQGTTSPFIGLGDPYTYDYKGVFIVNRAHWANIAHRENQYKCDIHRYKEMVTKLNRLCGYTKK